MSDKFTDLDLSPIDVLVFGGTGGLGRAISQKLAQQGAKVTVVGQTFRDSDIPNIKFIKSDLSSIESSQTLAKELDVSNTDAVLFTTGIFAATKREETKEGLEKDMAVSYLNRLAIINIIAPKLKKSSALGLGSSRIFLMGFPGNNQLGKTDDLNQESNYSYWTTHMNTVAGNESLVTANAKNYQNVSFYGLNPGLVKTNIRGNLLGDGFIGKGIESLIGWFTYTPEQYASNVAPLLVSKDLNGKDGKFYNNKAKEIPGSKGLTSEYAREFIKASSDVLKSKGFNV